MEELQTVYDKVTKGTDGDYASVDDLEKDAPNFAKLVHFYEENEQHGQPNCNRVQFRPYF